MEGAGFRADPRPDLANLPAAPGPRFRGSGDRSPASLELSRPAEEVANLLVRGLREVVVEMADGHERLGRLRADDLVDLVAELGAGLRGGDRHGHDDPSRLLPSKRS